LPRVHISVHRAPSNCAFNGWVSYFLAANRLGPA
jgi:hypothetical protein